MSHLGNSGFRCNLLSISRSAVLVSEIPFEQVLLFKLTIG